MKMVFAEIGSATTKTLVVQFGLTVEDIRAMLMPIICLVDGVNLSRVVQVPTLICILRVSAISGKEKVMV